MILSNNLSLIIEHKEQVENIAFKPNRQFFKYIGIGQKRFWQLVRNEKNITVLEAKRLAEYFGVYFEELHDFTLKSCAKNIELTIKPKPHPLEKMGLIQKHRD